MEAKRGAVILQTGGYRIRRSERQSLSRNDGLLQHDLTEAVFQLLEEKGLLKRQEVKDRIEKLKAETKLGFQMVQ